MRIGTSPRWSVMLAALALLAAKCGAATEAPSSAPAAGGQESAGEDSGGEENAGEAAAEGEPSVIRFAFAPDPVWDWLIDSGGMAEWEQEFNMRIETSQSWGPRAPL